MFLDFAVSGLVPAALVVLAGMCVRIRPADEKFARRWLLFLLAVAALLFGVQLLALGQERYTLGAFVEPAWVGALAALFVHLGATRALWSRKTIGITLPATLAVAALVVYWWEESELLALLISAVTALAWQAWEWRGKRRWLARLALLLLLLMAGGWILNPYLMLIDKPRWLYDWIDMGSLFVWPAVAIVLAARLVYTSIASGRPSSWPAIVARLAAAALLLLAVGDLIVTEMVWVQAEDGFAIIPEILFLVATAAAMLLAWAVKGWRRLGALVFALVVTLAVSWAAAQGWRMSPAGLTEARAAKIEGAIQRYYARQGHYPSRLANLTPFYLWRIPQPMIFRDQTWCYEGGSDYYRLGYVYQQGFGAPSSIRIPAAAGQPPESSWPCDEALERAKSRAPN